MMPWIGAVFSKRSVARAETIVSLQWIAQRLEMGTWTHVSNLLREAGSRRITRLRDRAGCSIPD